VHDHRLEPRVPQEDDVFGELLAQVLLGHRVAAVFDDDGRPVEAGQPGQCLDQCVGLDQGVGGPHDEYAEFSRT
jgi:hypothetical protein